MTNPTIKSISHLPHANGNTALIGLGEDNKTYFWSFDAGKWFPNWNETLLAVAATAVPNRAARRVAGKRR